MKHVTSAVVFASIFALQSSPAPAQTRPDFSGTWVMDAARSQSAVQDEPIRSMTVVITQAAIDLTIETHRDDKQQTITYKPGSADSLNAVNARSNLLSSTWYWDGPRLVTETLGDVNGATMRTRQVHALDPSGAEMTVETLVVVEHGYTLRGAQNYGIGKDIFRRVQQK
jgi:hypothetical protein